MKKELSNMIYMLVVVLMVLFAVTGCVLKYNPETGDVGAEITLTLDELMELVKDAEAWMSERGIEDEKVFVINGKRIRITRE